MVIIRALDAGEVPALATLGRSTFVETFGDLYTPEDLNSFLDRVYAESSVRADYENAAIRIQVAAVGAELVGYCKLGLAPHFDDYPANGREQIELKQLYIASAHHGAGVAQSLMDWAMGVAHEQNADEMVLSVWSQNHRAQAFYRKYGFDWVADTHFMVGNQRDEEFLFARLMR